MNRQDVSPSISTQAFRTKGRSGPLSGMLVLDLTHMLAGPYCTWLLGALGAQVIKIEMPGRGDFTRSIAPFFDSQSIYFTSVNRNKRSITLNLKIPSARAALLRITAQADVFVENNRPGVMQRLGLDYKSVAAINPKIIYASISGFGQTGPYSKRPAFDAVVQAMSGMMSITGEEEGPPVRVGMSIGDIGGSLFGAIGILSALIDRAATGMGAQIDVAMFDSQLALLENPIARYLNTGGEPRRLGSRHPLVAPFQAFPTKDAPIVICVDTEAQWAQLCEAIGRSDLVGHPFFADGTSRARNHAKLEPELIAALAKRTRAEWLSVLDAAGVPSGPINSISDAVEDPQVVARGMIRRTGTGRFASQPIRFSTYQSASEKPAPKLGEHTQEVLVEFGFSVAEISAMKSEGAI